MERVEAGPGWPLYQPVVAGPPHAISLVKGGLQREGTGVVSASRQLTWSFGDGTVARFLVPTSSPLHPLREKLCPCQMNRGL